MRRSGWFVAAVGLLAACGSGAAVTSSEPPPPTTVLEPLPGDGATLPPTDVAPLGATAVWRVASEVDPSGSSFVAMVTRLECAGGVTGEVYEPVIEMAEAGIVVTFFVAPLESDLEQSCVGNDEVPYEVDLGEPVGARPLLDGACREGSDASATSLCAGGAVRWAP